MRNMVTVNYGMAQRSPVPFGDVWASAHYRPARWESSETVGAYTTERGRRRVVARTMAELRASRGVRVVADAQTRRGWTLFYRDPYGCLRFAEVQSEG